MKRSCLSHRPEYYYNCKDITNAVTLDAGGNVPHDAAGDIIYSDPSKVVDFKFSSQEIKYTVANSTDITVNTQAKDVMDTGIKRDVDELIDVVQNAVNAHDKVSQIKNMMQQLQSRRLTMPTTICKRPTASTSHALMII